ncbi:MAG: virulence-associated family protein [Rhodocyclaceae bacterium]|nr:virulence-associated family protein [Rhodocyclaceae bacterium]
MTNQGVGGDKGKGRLPDIDFKRIASAALACADSLVREWLPDGHKVGHEWKARNPIRDDRREGSFSINLATGAWGDFATDDAKGKDLVSLRAYLFHDDDQVESAKYLAAKLGIPDAAPSAQPGERAKPPAIPREKADKPPKETEAKPPEAPKWVPVFPLPENAPPPPRAHEFRGIPERTWCYRDIQGRVLGYICRFVKSTGGKEITPLTYCRHEKTGAEKWCWVAFPEPRPLYGLDRLSAKPDATVLVVEGEKCADAGQAELPDLVVMTWPGGANAVDKADWSPLAGRKVMTWADADSQRKKLSKAEKEAGVDPLDAPYLAAADQPGAKAMAKVRLQLAARGCRLWNVDIPGPGEKPDGWDIADMIDDGWHGEDLAMHLRQHAKPWEPPSEESDSAPSDAGEAKRRPAGDPDRWRDNLLWKKGELSDCLANVYDILANRREWSGVLGFNEFSLRAVKLKPPPFANGDVGDWEGVDDSRTAIWLTRQEEITPTSARVMEAVETLARAHSFHPVRDWLSSLPKHDGTARIDTWLSDYLGVATSEYVRLVSRWYLIGMVARVMEPGVKFDTCLVLEGTQGKGKSTALSILAGDWFDDTDLDLNNKDAMASLQGVWLHEFAELGSLAKAEASKQKSFLTRRVDKYRPVYGRRDIKAPRQTVFAGSVNDWEWQKDPTGGRRFWPVMCTDALNLDGLRDNRDQLFAEALAAYLAKERFWPTAEQQKDIFDPEQLQREQPDSFIDALHDWVYGQTADFSVAMAVLEGLKLDASKLTRDTQTRVGIALRKLGCTRVEKRNGMVRYWYRPPTRKAASSEATQPAQQYGEGRRAPF